MKLVECTVNLDGNLILKIYLTLFIYLNDYKNNV